MKDATKVNIHIQTLGDDARGMIANALEACGGDDHKSLAGLIRDKTITFAILPACEVSHAGPGTKVN